MTTTMDPTVRGNQPAGPNRWRRAAQWAAEKPDSLQGMKYLARVKQAEAAAKLAPALAWEHWAREWRGAIVYKGQTCCTEHAMLQLQLAHSSASYDAYLPVILETPAEELHDFILVRKDTSKRKGACMVCGGPVPALPGRHAV